MNYSIDITVATKRDLADAFDYIDGMLMNPSAADRLIDNAWKQFRSLDIFPQRFPIVTDPMLAGWKIRFFSVQNYLVFYQIEEPAQVVHILRFLYGKSNWVSILKTDFSAEYPSTPRAPGSFFVALFLQFNKVSPLVKRFFVPQLAGRAVLCYPMRNFYM